MTDKPWNESRPAKGLHPSDAESWWYGDRDGIAIAKKKHPDMYEGGGLKLQVAWVPEGQRFTIEEYDGAESVTILGPDYGFVA